MRHQFRGFSYKEIIVSIHASVKDATDNISATDMLTCFNPRICKRCDFQGAAYAKTLAVSIHASVKDATPCL